MHHNIERCKGADNAAIIKQNSTRTIKGSKYYYPGGYDNSADRLHPFL